MLFKVPYSGSLSKFEINLKTKVMFHFFEFINIIASHLYDSSDILVSQTIVKESQKYFS